MLPPPSPVSAAPGLDVPDPSADPERCPPAFRLDRRDLALVRRQRRPANQLALALRIGCVRCTDAYAGDLAGVPAALAEAVRGLTCPPVAWAMS
ncbi:MAG: DUF4158 domain-containing protein [Chloroflexi bacterium]|nr:DUF4158 domain-containing protein [Chloroflexota bacterium]